jgi:hypothetical protein
MTDGERAELFAVMAMLRYEYADAMLDARADVATGRDAVNEQ